MRLVLKHHEKLIVVHPDLRGLFLDLDGTLFDTFPAHWEATNRALVEIGHQSVPWDLYRDVSIRTGQKITSELPGVAADDFYRAKDRHYLTLAKAGLRARDGARDFLNTARAADIPIVIVTTARRASVLALRDAVWDLPEPDAIVAWEDTVESKPKPDPYLAACERVNVSPLHGVAVEDSPIGCKSALAAWLRCIAVSTNYYDEEDFPPDVFRVGSFRTLELRL